MRDTWVVVYSRVVNIVVHRGEFDARAFFQIPVTSVEKNVSSFASDPGFMISNSKSSWMCVFRASVTKPLNKRRILSRFSSGDGCESR